MADDEQIVQEQVIEDDEQEVEAYCTDSIQETESTEKRQSIDQQINQLAEDILLYRDIPLDVYSLDEKANFQDRIDILVAQMRQITEYMNGKCKIIDKMNILMCILSLKIFDMQHEFNVKLDDIKEQRENILLSKVDEGMIPIELLDLDRIVRELQIQHHQKTKGFKQQKIEIQLEYEKFTIILDKHLEIIRRNLKILAEEHEKFANEVRQAEPILIDYIIQAALEEFTIVADQFEEKQKKGWKSFYGDEEIIDILQSRGLAISKSGYILTEAGEKLTYDEAERKKLLVGLDFRSRLFPKSRGNDDIVTTPSSVTADVTEKESLASQISTEDVSYLKETLGKPLTLALAEITAKQPRDPIHYLGHWLFKYRYNQELDITQKQEYEALMLERNRLLKEKLHRLYEEEARLVIFEMINNAENGAIRRELERILREQVLGGEDDENDQAAREHAELKKLLQMMQKTPDNQ